ncbi:flavodoxin family protein [Staphylococcus ratti]|uniref:FMN-dependent NADPH-azoreductase n=1 Tax=Staphylococcus ratti TaxID=2892440 RepID=A0ABY3PC28_9STAP|nr:flavodoxin family protein [Staphylococcus ratti]UEX89868.1 flavodoxin family protein [Staphylococcus ratti]
MITVLFGGSRENGNTATLTRKVLEGHEHQWINLTQLSFKPVRDVRHEENHILSYNDDYQTVIDQVLQSDEVIFASPVYWYSVSATLKSFIDHWSETLQDPRYHDFKERMENINFRLVLVGGDSPRIKALPCVQQIEYSLQFLGAHLADYLIGYAEKPEEIYQDHYAIREAERWNNYYG